LFNNFLVLKSKYHGFKEFISQYIEKIITYFTNK